jgi:Rrf2 family protein
MLTKTSISAIRALIYLGRNGDAVTPPRTIADTLGESPSYLAKVLGQLVKAGILRAARGTKGGVQLNRLPSRISLLSIVEACQGIISGNYCPAGIDLRSTCAYHQAAVELQEAIVAVLSRWNLAHLIERPQPGKISRDGFACLLLEGGQKAHQPGTPSAVGRIHDTPGR